MELIVEKKVSCHSILIASTFGSSPGKNPDRIMRDILHSVDNHKTLLIVVRIDGTTDVK